MADKHAVLSASSSYRWLVCPPSAQECAKLPDTPSEFARQGTEAHTLCEFKVNTALGQKLEAPTESLTYFDEEMAECTDEYAQFVMESLASAKASCKDPMIMVEQRLDFSKWVPGGFGTGDCLIVADDTLTVIDYKHGLGVLVDAEKNPQMMCYALGALNLFDGIYDIKQVSMTIFQPRRDNISTCTMSKEELLQWAETVLKPAAELAAKGEGEYKAGDHCRFCKIKATCRKRAEYNLELAQYDFAVPSTLQDEEIEAVLSKADELVNWASDVKEYALQQALSGKQWDGWKLVEGRSNRRYVSEEAVAAKVEEAGFDPYEKKLLVITAMTKELGKKRFEELLSDFIEKPQGRPVLVPESDQRPAMHTAADDFHEENKEETIMSKNYVNPCKVITGVNTRWSYANVWEPKSINGGTPKYSVSLIIPKSDTKTVEKIRAAIKAAYKEGENKLRGNGRAVPALEAIKTPLRDGDLERPGDDAYKDSFFVNANSTTKPGIVDADCQHILERSEVYSGVYGRASINFYAFNSNGNKGIACGLNNLQKIRDGEPLGGKPRAEDDFATADDHDFLA